MSTPGCRENAGPRVMTPPTGKMRKSQVSAARQWLIEATQRLGYGRIKHLLIINHEPVVDPPPKICPRRKLTGPRYCPREIPSGDFILKEQVVNLFDEMDTMDNGVIAIDVRDGLPCDITNE